MAGTRTAPLFTAAATGKRVTMTFIDLSGDEITHSLLVPVATTPAALEALAADIAERTNASLYATEIIEIRKGTRSTANATADPRSQSVFDHVLLTVKDDSTGMSQRVYIPAPLEAVMESVTSDNPNMTDLIDVGGTAIAVAGAGYVWVSARYTERREINTLVKR